MLFLRAYSTSFSAVVIVIMSILCFSSYAYNPYIGEIRMFSGDFQPSGWHYCDGREISRTEYKDLFDAIGTTYGSGNSVTTFNLPDLRGRAPVHYIPGDPNYQPGQQGGIESVALGSNQIPAHSHSLNVQSNFATYNAPKARVLAVPFLTTNYCPSETPKVDGSAETISSVGGNQAHTNMQPYLDEICTIAYCSYCDSRSSISSSEDLPATSTTTTTTTTTRQRLRRESTRISSSDGNAVNHTSRGSAVASRYCVCAPHSNNFRRVSYEA